MRRRDLCPADGCPECLAPTVREETTIDLDARSASRRVWELIQEGAVPARVSAVFERACIVTTAGGAVLALVVPQIGDGPNNIVVDCEAGGFAGLHPGNPVHVSGDRLQIGNLVISLARASVWEPRPGWERLRTNQDSMAQRLPLLLSVALDTGRPGGLLHLFSTHRSRSSATRTRGQEMPGRTNRDPAARPQGDLAPAILVAARAGAEALEVGWEGNQESLRQGVAQLAGLGSGLTPAGDDFLTGFMLWAWLAHPAPHPLCREIAGLAAPRTTALSTAFLTAAAEGECSAAWHDLLGALHSTPARLPSAVGDVLSYGQTSGADALAGFLWMASKTFSAESGSSLKRMPRAS